MIDFQYTYDLSDIDSLIQQLERIKWFNNQVVVFYGDLGSGKTTLIKKLCESIGVEDNISSPTFALINEYYSEKKPIYHIDLYRVKSKEEALDIGIEEYMYSDGICLIEWPQIIEDLLPLPYIKIEIENLGKFTRRLQLIEIDAPR